MITILSSSIYQWHKMHDVEILTDICKLFRESSGNVTLPKNRNVYMTYVYMTLMKRVQYTLMLAYKLRIERSRVRSPLVAPSCVLGQDILTLSECWFKHRKRGLRPYVCHVLLRLIQTIRCTMQLKKNYNPELSKSTLQSNFKGLIRIQRKKKCFILYGVYVSSVADIDRPKKRVTPWSKRN